jgi:DNA-directed RNA polymerase subunit RPC12/RpoP
MTDESTHSPERYVCDRCGTAVTLPEALITGELDGPEGVVCGGCTKPEDRIITDGEAR